MSEDEKKEKAFVVKDKRRFDSTGNERGDEDKSVQDVAKSTPKKSEPKLSPKSESVAPESSDSGEDNNGNGIEFDFSSFIMSLATQALMQLGEIKPPPGMNIGIDRNSARQSIEIIGMLQVKTKGNLDADESRLIEQILHNLRLSYVKASS